MRPHGGWMLGLAMAAAAPFVFAQCSSSSGNTPDAGLADSTSGSSGSGGSSSGLAGSGSGSGSSSSSSSSGAGSSSGSGSSSGPSSSSSSGGPVDSGNPGDSGHMDATESGPACDTPDGGAPCNPGIVPCGGDAGGCITSTSACCTPAPPDGGAQGTCVASSVTCGQGMAKIQCKEAADCPSGYVCCETFPGIATLGSTTCMQSCTGYSTYQICRTNSECGTNEAGAPVQCVPQTCTPPMGPGGGGGPTVSLEACYVQGTMGMMNNGALPYCMPN